MKELFFFPDQVQEHKYKIHAKMNQKIKIISF